MVPTFHCIACSSHSVDSCTMLVPHLNVKHSWTTCTATSTQTSASYVCMLKETEQLIHVFVWYTGVGKEVKGIRDIILRYKRERREASDKYTQFVVVLIVHLRADFIY